LTWECSWSQTAVCHIVFSRCKTKKNPKRKVESQFMANGGGDRHPYGSRWVKVKRFTIGGESLVPTNKRATGKKGRSQNKNKKKQKKKKRGAPWVTISIWFGKHKGKNILLRRGGVFGRVQNIIGHHSIEQTGRNQEARPMGSKKNGGPENRARSLGGDWGDHTN